MRWRLVAAALLVTAGCTVGPGRRFNTDVAPEGALLEVSVLAAGPLVRAEVRGELLEVRKDALLVLGMVDEVVLEPPRQVAVKREARQRQVVLLPFANVVRARFDKLGSGGSFSDRKPPSAAAREKLRLVSRFPQGLAPEYLQRLLAAEGQTEVRRLGP